jgi:hypothetical protein
MGKAIVKTCAGILTGLLGGIRMVLIAIWELVDYTWD